MSRIGDRNVDGVIMWDRLSSLSFDRLDRASPALPGRSHSITSGNAEFDTLFARSGFSLAETVVSIVLVGGLLVVALNTVGAATLGRQKMGDRGRGQLLAQDLMAEILQQAYEEPVDTPIFGRESSESGGSRTDYDDVDDYHGWDASPPEYKDGTEIAGLTGWRRSVIVEYVDPDDLPGVVASDLGVKRITVTVRRGDAVVGSLVGVRAAAADEDESG